MSVLKTTIVEFDVVKHTHQILSIDALNFDTHDQNKIYWIHADLNQPHLLRQLTEKLRLPDHLVKLCAEKNPLPKLTDHADALTIQIECLLADKLDEHKEMYFGELIFHLTERYCFTATHSAIPALHEFEKNYSKALAYAKTPCFILFLILDNVINDFSALLLDFELIADQIDVLIHEVQADSYGQVMEIKKQVMKVQHHIAVIRDILMRISGRKIAVISEPCRESLGNLLNHSQIIFNEAEATREVLKNTHDQIDNALMQRMNSTIKLLTAFAAIFLPLSLIASIFGMNFLIPEEQWEYGYYWALGLMVMVTVLLILVFRKMKWF